MPKPEFRPTAALFALLLTTVVMGVQSAAANPQTTCAEEPPLEHWTLGGANTCPCFSAGEEAGAVFDVPAAHYPIEILRVGFGWGSQFGGTPASLEQAIHIYGAGFPDPGTPIFSLPGPVLTDGFINNFDLEPLPGEILINSGPFTVTLEFLNTNAGDPFAASIVNDGTACQMGKNIAFAIPGGWTDICTLGLSGDHQVTVIYRRTDCGTNQNYCVSSVNSTGLGATIGFAGSSSVAANDLLLLAQQTPSNVFGLFYYGTSQLSAPFGDGVRCVGGTTLRIQPPVTSDFFGNVVIPIDNTLPPFDMGAGAITSGAIWNYQFWYRDIAGPGGTGFNLSNGLELTFVP